ncbi:hypothetical protein HZA97_05170 [Candidatus Woesearchaeota archaeon]|nr:hypothetical protein [Candidatus Woesearchaeota archaeon]
MSKYIIRTDGEEKKTHIYAAESGKELGVVYTDFTTSREQRDIRLEDILNPKTNKKIGRIELFVKDEIAVVRRKKLIDFSKKGIASLKKDETYKEEGKEVEVVRLPAAVLLRNEKYKQFDKMGLTHAYFLDGSPIEQVFCFLMDGNVSGIVYTKETGSDVNTALKALPLVLQDRLMQQEYVFELFR